MAGLLEDREGDTYHNFQYQKGRDQPSDVRDVLLVVAALVAAVTFQAGLQPPGGLWQENGNGTIAGCAILASNNLAFNCYLVSNTVAFTASLLVIVTLTAKFPFSEILVIALLAMFATYASAIYSITPDGKVNFTLYKHKHSYNVLLAIILPAGVMIVAHICSCLE